MPPRQVGSATLFGLTWRRSEQWSRSIQQYTADGSTAQVGRSHRRLPYGTWGRSQYQGQVRIHSENEGTNQKLENNPLHA